MLLGHNIFFYRALAGIFFLCVSLGFMRELRSLRHLLLCAGSEEHSVIPSRNSTCIQSGSNKKEQFNCIINALTTVFNYGYSRLFFCAKIKKNQFKKLSEVSQF